MNDAYHRSRTARRAMTLAPLAPSQDVSRYPAKFMPRPTFDLDRRNEPASMVMILARTLAFVAAGAGIVLIQRIGTWLSP